MKITKKIAGLVSFILNPALLGILIIIATVLRSSMGPGERTVWLLVVLILNGVVPLCFYLFFTQKGYVFDGTLDNPKVQRQRISIFLVLLTTVSVQLLILASIHPYKTLLLVFVGGLISLVSVLFITYYWKISLHSGMVTFFVLMVIWVYGIHQTWPILLLLPAVFWSRIVLARHTIWQLFGGVALAIIVSIMTYLVRGIV